jgi:hypothetical protein
MDGLGDVKLVVQRDHGGGGGGVGKEDGAEIGVADAGPVKGAVEGVAAGDLLGGDVLILGVAGVVDLCAVVSEGGVLVAEAAGPGDEGAEGGSVAENLDVGVEDVGLVEGEGLGDVEAAGGVVEVSFAGAVRFPVAEGT